MNRPNPLSDANWNAISRECALTRSLIGTGATSLGYANYADRVGDYYSAFFNLSIGFERILKLILVAAYVRRESGKAPAKKYVKNFGHDIEKLTNEVKKVCAEFYVVISDDMSNDAHVARILKFLGFFSEARRGRYAHFDLGDPVSLSENDPLKKWWNDVVEPILEESIYGTKIDLRIKSNAALVGVLLDGASSVRFRNETGDWMEDAGTASLRTGYMEQAQRLSRYHCLRGARWFAEIFCELTHPHGYSDEFYLLFGHYEHFQTYTVDNSFLLNRKIWPLR